MDPYESPRVDPYAPHDLENADLLPPHPAGEQLGMLHGLLYVAGLGAAAAINVHVREVFLYREFRDLWWPVLILVALDGAGLAAMVLALWRRIERRRTFPAHFGHWMLLALGVDCLLYGVYQLIFYALIAGVELDEAGQFPPDVESRLRTINSLINCLGVVTPALGMYFSKGQILWQRYAPLMMASALWFAVRLYFDWEQNRSAIAVTNVLSFLGLLCFLIATGRDIRQPESKDQVHWVGLGVHCALIFYYRFLEFYGGPE